MNLRLSALVATAVIATSLASAQSSPTPAIPADRQHWIDVAHKLETAPLDEDAFHDARFVIAEIAVLPDFPVALCSDLYTDFNESQYKYKTQIRYLFMLGGATYKVETGKTDIETTNLYALHSVLKGYAAILRQEPAAKDKMLDNLAKEDARGKLADLISKKTCKQLSTP
jgi:hypothetical protein